MDENKNGAENTQNIDGVLEELKKSYSSDATAQDFSVTEQDASADVSKDELQEKLRSQFLNDNVHNSYSDSDNDDYAIDEDFLNDAYTDDVTEAEATATDEEIFEENDEEFFEDIDEDFSEELDEEFSEEIEENEYELYEGFGEVNTEVEDEEAYEKEMETLQEVSIYEGLEEIQEEEIEEDYQENQEIPVYEGLEEIQEETDSETLEEIYASQEVQEVQEEAEENIQLESNRNYLYEDFMTDSEYLNWAGEAPSGSAVAVATEEIEETEYPIIEDESSQKLAEDNYVGMFYRSNDEGPFGNRSFKEIIAETTMSVDSLEAALNADSEDSDYETEIFDEVESVPLVIEEEENSANRDLDNADLALLLEFGYKDDLLKTVSSENMEKLSTEEFENDIDEMIDTEEPNEQSEPESEAPVDKKVRDTNELRKARTAEKIKNQYLSYRKDRGAALLKLLISAVFALMLVLYELLPIFGASFPSFMDRGKNFALYVFFGLVLLLAVAIPTAKQMFESFKNFLANGIDAYIIAASTACITLLYDFIIIFALPDTLVAPTFHLCVAILIVLAEFSEFLKAMTETRNYEYYFSEFVFGFEDEDDIANYKYTLQKSEGRGSIAEKMYAGGVSPKRVICAPQSVDSANGFFDANKQKSKATRITFSLIIISAVLSFVFTIISAIVSETFWVSIVAFMATLGFTMPIIAVVAEWLPFERLSANNYAYGAAFASEASIEKAAACDMFVFYDLHLFEKCDSKSVNLAIYDSTSKATLLSCLSSVYAEIGGPLQSALASVKAQSYGEANIVRVARTGVEATVASYSVLVGDEQFMSNYGITFPTASLGREEDKIFTLCVSLNGRPTARIAVKYKLNDVFLRLVQQISQDKIACVVETYDPMISTALVSKLRTQKGFQINIVHKNAADLALEKYRKNKDAALFSALGKDLPLLARGSRLNLAVATSNAKKIKLLRFIFNIATCVTAFVGLLISFILVLTGGLKESSSLELFVILYWLLSGAIVAGIMIWKFPKKDRFIFTKKEKDRN